MKSIKSYKSKSEDNECFIRLDSNESYIDVERDKKIMMKGILNKVPFNRYPDNESCDLRKLYADYVQGIKIDNILAGNGSDEMIGLVIGALINQGKKVLTFSKEFSMYEYYTSINGGEIVRYETEEDGKVCVDDFIDFGKKEDVDLIIFSNPNNPTGNILSNEDIEKILLAFPDTYVLVDEAYYEFYGESMIEDIGKFNNLLVTRTLSKAWGLAALRVGFLISCEKNIEKFKEVKVPYTISGISRTIAESVLKNKRIVEERSKEIICERENLYNELNFIEKEAAMEIKFYKSNANFIFGRTPYKEALFTALKRRKITIRNFKDDTFRITVGSNLENRRLIETIKEVFIYGGEACFE
ncbi:MAG: histidinol-phosphate transaminase [Clostridium sp.]|uniref:histidinol-phosphate transaminase n=1 Tax=Clostridium sp. DSM 8431 TaxID=1761781 RepID=UPI0008E50E93|nr:histidinol-phosphate transaminase [Clostridium sp. DSM 8431]MCR4944232.1 histidinol-phosphate transaminase [Clostridium sp.]SFU86075.1 histidinol-phosphate aminotransferase [Clostridium sp. DSM 8431]